MITIFFNKPKNEGKETFISIKKAKSFLEKLAEEGVHDPQVFVHTGKYDWSKDFTHEVHWTTETNMFSIQFENEAMARAFYSQMVDLYADSWHSVYLFEHLGQGRLARLRYAVKV